MSNEPICPKCGSNSLYAEPGPHPGGHHAKLICLTCRDANRPCFIKWLAKPDEDKAKRPSAHRKLVKKFSRGFCELCLRREDELPSPETLEGHHVVEYADGGNESRENTWILCSACHSLVNWRRTYMGHYRKVEEPADVA